MTFMANGELKAKLTSWQNELKFTFNPTETQCINFIFKYQADVGAMSNAEYNLREYFFTDCKQWNWKNMEIKAKWHEVYFLFYELSSKRHTLPVFKSTKEVVEYLKMLSRDEQFLL